MKVVFVLSPGYATLPEPLQFVYTMVTTIAEGRFSVIIPAPNRTVDPNNYYPYRSELPAIWDDIPNAIQGFKDCSTTRLVLDEVLGLELSNFARLLKLRPGVDDDHLLVQQVANDLWFRQMDHAENEQGRTVRKKYDVGRRGSHGIGFEYEATHQCMVVLVTEIVYFGGRCVRACTGGDQRGTRVPEKLD